MCPVGSVVSLDARLNNEGFDQLGNVLLLVSGHVEYNVILYYFSYIRLPHKTFSQNRSLPIWLLWHQIFCFSSKKIVLNHVICITIGHRSCHFFD